MILASLFKPRANPARPLYEAIVAAARQPWAYREAQVPDTVDGRFDFLVLHLCLVLGRLGQDLPAFKQTLIDYFCTDMDDNLRELGAGDLSVAKKVRRMAEALAGRFAAYDAAQDRGSMEQAIQRNVFSGKAGPGVAQLATYAIAARGLLQAQMLADLQAGKVHFA